HADKVQEEVFVVVSGTLTMQLGDPPERVDVGAPGLVAVEPGTPLLVRNEGDVELVLYIYGAPAEQGGADFFEDTGALERRVQGLALDMATSARRRRASRSRS